MRDIPLHLLRVFEASARLQSYTDAGKELHVTHSAVSQQMRRLEAAVGGKLLVRDRDRMVLTALGARLFERVAPAMGELRAAAATFLADSSRAEVRLTTIPSLATYWLVPRVSRFQSPHGTAVSIDTSVELKAIAPGSFDLALRHGRGYWLGCNAERLFDDELIAVCSPTYRGGDLPRHPSELTHHSLLTYAGSPEWQQWATQAGCDHRSLHAVATLSDAALMMSATIAGHGIAIGRSAIILTHLRLGDLVPLFGIRVRAAYSYFLVTAADAVLASHVEQFIGWLRAEARQTQLQLEQLLADI